MATYREIRQQIEDLTPDEQFCLLEELIMMVRRRLHVESRRNIMELEGLGKEIWDGLDAQEYVDRERASWNG